MAENFQWDQELKKRGFRLTKAREIIMNLLDSTAEHLSADDVYMQLHSRYPEIGLTTVYRTLELLTGVGMAVKFDFGDGRARFELAEAYGKKPHHHHLICRSCNKIIDYNDFMEEELAYIKLTEEGLENKFGFQIDGHQIQFYGSCTDCRNQV